MPILNCVAATSALEGVLAAQHSFGQQLAQLVATLPADAVLEVLHYPQFTAARIQADEAQWETAFAAIDSAKLRAWLDAQKAADEDVRPKFDAAGNIAA